MAAGFRTIILTGLTVGGIGGFVVPDLKHNDAVAIQDRGEKAPGVDAEPFGALHATAIAERRPSDVDTGQRRPVGLGEAEERETTLADPLQMRAQESPPVQIAALTPLDDHLHLLLRRTPRTRATVFTAPNRQIRIVPHASPIRSKSR
jgi:hypothetical protein